MRAQAVRGGRVRRAPPQPEQPTPSKAPPRAMSPASIPALLWRWYVDALWNYSPDSWVASTAYTFRLLALIVILPGVLLTLLVRALLRCPAHDP